MKHRIIALCLILCGCPPSPQPAAPQQNAAELWEQIQAPAWINPLGKEINSGSIYRTRVPSGWLVLWHNRNGSCAAVISDTEHLWLKEIEKE